MRKLLIAVAMTVVLAAQSAFARTPITENAAVDHLKRTSASRLDPALPSKAFGAWVTAKFPGWDVFWQMNDCGEATGTPTVDSKRDLPVCVQVDITQPADATHGYHLVFQVGTERKGLITPPQFRFATREDGEAPEDIEELSQVEP